MANTFKNDFAANVNHAAYVDLYTVPSSTTTVILGLALCNKTANAVNVTVQMQDTSDIVLLTGAQTLASKTLTSPVLNTGISGSAIKDQDDMSSNSATHLVTQQSVKAYVDTQVATGASVDDATALAIALG